MPISILKGLQPLFDNETRRGGQQAIKTGRSWWAVRLSSIDDWVHEWDLDPASPNGHRDWIQMMKQGRQAVRLYCPNGKVVQLGDLHDATGRLFQFKQGRRNVSVGQFGELGEDRTMLAHVVGMVHGLMGECTYYAWELLPAPEIPSDAPKAPNQQEWIAKSAEPGLYEAAVVDWERQVDEYQRTPQYRQWERRYDAWERNAKGRLVGPVDDNVYRMSYLNGTALHADYLGLDDGESR